MGASLMSAAILLSSVLLVPGATVAADSASDKAAGGLAVYLGVLPAAMIQSRYDAGERRAGCARASL